MTFLSGEACGIREVLRNRSREAALNPQESAEAIVRKYGTPESGRAEPKGERKPMRSREEQRQQKIS